MRVPYRPFYVTRRDTPKSEVFNRKIERTAASKGHPANSPLL